MNKQTSEAVIKEIRNLESETYASTGKNFRVFSQNDPNGDHEIKVFETNSDGTTSGGLITIVKLVAIANKFNTNCIVRVEWKDDKGAKNKPNFIFF